MSVLELKQEITRLNKRQREEISAYLVHLNHDTAEWKLSAARRVRAMRNGKGVTSEQLEARLGMR